jgi:tetratricopeptide (TPR) repeat protein
MSFWRRMFGKGSRQTVAPQRLDYLNEGLALERQGDFEAALTSYRLAFRDNPTDSRILLNMAIACTKTGQDDEAIRHYKRALELDDSLGGAHYGVAFLLKKRGETDEAAKHLKAFLARPAKGPDAERWVKYAESELEKIAGNKAPKASETG